MTRDDRSVRFICTPETSFPARGPHAASVRWLGSADYPLALEAWRLRGGSPTRQDWKTAWPTMIRVAERLGSQHVDH